MILRSITNPLTDLVRQTRKLAVEDYDARVDESGTDELAELGRHFNAMARRLGRLDQVRQDFLSSVSHDLKGPLASMHETTSLLLEGVPGPITTKQARLLKLNLNCGSRLSVLIGRLLDYSCLNSGMWQYDFQVQNVKPLVEATVNEIEPLALEKDCQIRFACAGDSVEVRCDKEAIERVVRNLLDNALAFAPMSSKIDVCLETEASLPESLGLRVATVPEGRLGYVSLSVEDQGPGVPAADKERIFSKFFKVGEIGDSGSGLGLGLAICSRFIEDHGGLIWVEDGPVQGSIFRILLAQEES
jgi:signal transduction histidine kinase